MYTDREFELAQELGEVAAANLRAAGWVVDHDEKTGTFVVRDEPKPPGTAKSLFNRGRHRSSSGRRPQPD